MVQCAVMTGFCISELCTPKLGSLAIKSQASFVSYGPYSTGAKCFLIDLSSGQFLRKEQIPRGPQWLTNSSQSIVMNKVWTAYNARSRVNGWKSLELLIRQFVEKECCEMSFFSPAIPVPSGSQSVPLHAGKGTGLKFPMKWKSPFHTYGYFIML